MKIIPVLLVFLSIAAHSQSRKVRIEKMRELSVMIGSWDVDTKILPPGNEPVPETGSMTCTSLYDSTYIECNVALTNSFGKRGYKSFITYDPDSSRYVQHYLYSNMAILITETGDIKNKEFTTVAKFNNAKGESEIVTAVMKIKKGKLLYESRSSLTNNEIDYVATFKKRTN